MSAIAVIGLQWGDEGKGKIVDCLAGDARHVARFQGGHNAGHTLLVGDKKIVLHLLPAGVLRAGVRCYIGNGVVVSPPALLKEIQLLENDGGDLRERLFIADNAALILPYHTAMDCAREHKNKIGTTKRGIGPAYEDKTGRRAVRFYDVVNGDGEAKIADTVSFYNDMLARHQVAARLQAAEIWDDLCAQTEKLRPYLCDDVGGRLWQAARDGDNVLLEGAQGSMLDIEQGTYPFTTSSSCLAAAAAGGLGVDLSPRVLGVIKAYCTRVGNGPFPTELIDDRDGEILAERGDEFGATTQRARRCGWLDIPMLRHALRVNGCRHMIMTKLDIFDAFTRIKVCVEYELDGARRQLPPADPALLQRCRPVYETLAGWHGETTMGATDFAALPANAQAYVRQLERWLDASIDIISTGADRDATIVNTPAFGGG